MNSIHFHKEALTKDKRNYFNYYISLIKTKQPIIFYFFLKNDNNSKVIKLSLFILSVSIYYFINTLFFNQSVIHKIYIDKGIYNFSYFLTYIIKSFIISHIIIIIIRYLSLTDRNINEIKGKKIKDLKNKAKRVKKDIIKKSNCFFIMGLLFLFFLWYYLSFFGAVFHGSQFYPIKNTLICLGIAQIYPFMINILPGIFRIPALKNYNRECLYKISQIIQLI